VSKVGRVFGWLGAPQWWLCVALLVSGCSSGGGVTLRSMIGNGDYWPPACHSNPCVLTGMGGITEVWNRHVDKHLALGRRFVVKGTCASACELAARRAHAKVLPGARLIYHKPSPTVWS
jgi:hypothetical protein